MSSTGAVGTGMEYDATMLAMHREDQSGSLSRLQQTLSFRGSTQTTKWKTFLAQNTYIRCLTSNTVNSNSSVYPIDSLYNRQFVVVIYTIRPYQFDVLFHEHADSIFCQFDS